MKRALLSFRFPWRSAADLRRDVDDELGFHLALHAEELERGGLSSEDARLEALRQFGNLESTRQALVAASRRTERARRALVTIEGAWRETRRALRFLRRKRGFTICATAVLALSIGSSVVVFSLVDTLVWRPLPLWQPDQLVSIGERPPAEAQWTMQTVRLSVLAAWQANATSLEQVGGFVDTQLTWRGPEGPEQLGGGAIVGDVFPLLGAAMTLGTGFGSADASILPVVLSHGFWQRRFGSRPDVVGDTMDVDGVTYSVVGVLPADTGLPMLGLDRVVWLPLADALRTEDSRVHVVGRLRPTVSAAAATEELARLQRAVEDDLRVATKAAGVIVQSMFERRTELAGPTLIALFGGALLLLLIACVNVGTLSVVQLIERRREIAVRASLGATRWHVAWQLAVQQIVLWSIGGAVGVAVGTIGLRAVLATYPFAAEEIPTLDGVALDVRAVLFACVTTLTTAVVFGVLPAFAASSTNPAEVIREDSATASVSRRSSGWRRLLVVAQVALSTVLTSTAGLLGLSLLNLTSQPLGFDADDVVVLHLQLPQQEYPNQARRLQFQRALLSRIRGVSGVETAATTSALPLGTIGVGPIGLEGRDVSSDPPWAGVQAVDQAYLATARIRLLQGRGFDETDRADSDPVVVVNETFAEKYFPGEQAIGKHLSITPATDDSPRLRIVGIAGDVKHAGLSWDYLPEIFVPYEQITEGPFASFLGADLFVVFRVQGAIAPSARILRDTISELDRGLPVLETVTGRQVVARSAKGAQFRAVVVGGTAALAILLAGLGLYGVLAQTAVQRRKELGIRMALGATPSALLRSVCGAGVAFAAIGVAIGLVAAVGVGRYVKSSLFGVDATDPRVFAGVALLMLVAAACAAIGPAWRATQLNPTLAFRNE